MSEVGKGLARDEVAARRAALTDGRWRNREGVGMYQRSTSNALRGILSGFKSALPTLSRARPKSRSRSNSPIKRKIAEAGKTVDSPKAGSSKLHSDRTPKSTPKSARKSKSLASALGISTAGPSPSHPTSTRKSPRRKSKAGLVTEAKAKPKANPRVDSDGEPEVPVHTLLEQRREQIVVAEPEQQDEQAPLDTVEEVEEAPAEAEESMEVVPDVPAPNQPKAGVASLEDSVVVLQEERHEEPESEPELELQPEPEPEPQPKPSKGKSKSKIQTIVPEAGQHTKPKASKPRKVSGSKRPAPADEDQDETTDQGSSNKVNAPAAKRAKNNKGKSKAKPQPKKNKPRKQAEKSKSRAKASRSNASDSDEADHHAAPASPTPPPQDIMVPLQDSPPSRPKEKLKRRRYTLMPIRTKEEMAHPDYDPLDCIGWQ